VASASVGTMSDVALLFAVRASLSGRTILFAVNYAL
jgi:hypothetical protein